MIWISIIASTLILASANDSALRKQLHETNNLFKHRSLLEEATSFVTDDDVIAATEGGNIEQNQELVNDDDLVEFEQEMREEENKDGDNTAYSNSGNEETSKDVDGFIAEDLLYGGNNEVPGNDDLLEFEEEMNGGGKIVSENDDLVEVEEEMKEDATISISNNVELDANFGEDDDLVEVEEEMNPANEDIPSLGNDEHYIDSNIETNRIFLQDDDILDVEEALREKEYKDDDDVAKVFDDVMKEAQTMNPPTDAQWLTMLHKAKEPSAQYHEEQQQQLDIMVKDIIINENDDDILDSILEEESHSQSENDQNNQQVDIGDDEMMSEGSIPSSFNSLIDTSLPWHEQINIPYVEKKTLTYDILFGCIIAFAFTMVLLVAFCIAQHCCDFPSFLGCLYVEKDHPHHWNQRRRTRKRQKLGSNYKHNNFIIQWLGNRKEQMYSSIVETPEEFHKRERQSLMKNKRSNVSVDSWGTESDDEYGELPPMDPDMDRLEYGESIDSDYDDDVDYSLIDKDTGRYEKDQIETAAKQYFSEDRVKNFFTAAHTVDSDSEDSQSTDSSDSPLDLEMIEKKMVRSIENANAFTGKK